MGFFSFLFCLGSDGKSLRLGEASKEIFLVRHIKEKPIGLEKLWVNLKTQETGCCLGFFKATLPGGEYGVKTCRIVLRSFDSFPSVSVDLLSSKSEIYYWSLLTI